MSLKEYVIPQHAQQVTQLVLAQLQIKKQFAIVMRTI
jgi:hypothetical protein